MNNEGEKKPSLRETARRYVEAKKATTETPPPPPKAAPPATFRDRPFIPFVRFEDVVVKCGHVEKFGILPDNKDRFREARRKKATDRNCKACREEKQKQLEAEHELRRAEKALAPKTQPKVHAERLPDGSRFEVRFDAASAQWHGTLTVTGADGTPVVLTGSRSGLFPLLTNLDKQYRATLGVPPATEEIP